MTAKTVVDVILGEAKAGSYQDMLAIASVISNRATGGKTSWQDVVARTPEFNAYGNPLPRGVNKYRSMAQKAIDQVKTTGPVHNATFYATPNKLKNLPKGLDRVTETDGHVFLTDPQKRPIYTGSGLKRIDYAKINDSISTTVSDDSLMNLEYNSAGLPGANAPIPSELFSAEPKSNGLGLANLVPSQVKQNEQFLESLLTGNWEGKPEAVQNLDPDFQSRLGPFLRTVDGAKIFSAYRSPSYQAKIISNNMGKYGFGSKQRTAWNQDVAKMGPEAAGRKWRSTFRSKGLTKNIGMPGTSNHQRGLAVDLRYADAATRARAHKEAESFGLTFRMGHEPWHVEPIKGWDRQVNPEFGLTPINPPTPRSRNEPQTSAAPFGQVERQELGPAKRTPSASDYQDYRQSPYQAPKKSKPAPIDQSTNLYPSGQPQASDYSNYQMMKKHSALPLGMAAPKPVARPTDLPKPTYTPKASDYSNYMMNVKQPTIPTPAARPADLGPMAVIDGPVGKPIQNVPIPAPTLKRESRFDKAKRTFGNNLKEQLKPETIAARGAGALIGGLLGGPMGARAGSMFGPQIAQRLNGNRQQGLFGGLFNQNNSVPIPTNRYMSSSSSTWGNADNQGATYTASDGATITGLGNGTYSRTNPITGKSSQWNADGSRSTKGY
jgi:hypothetical protein